MIDSNFPCALCPCEAWKHYKSIATGKDICIICYSNKISPGGPEYKLDPIHEFVADNLRYLEMKEEENARFMGMPGVNFNGVTTGRVGG